MKKRVLSLLLALVMAFSFMPTLAFAEGHEGEERDDCSEDSGDGCEEHKSVSYLGDEGHGACQKI